MDDAVHRTSILYAPWLLIFRNRSYKTKKHSKHFIQKRIAESIDFGLSEPWRANTDFYRKASILNLQSFAGQTVHFD